MARITASTAQIADYLVNGYWRSIGQGAHKFQLGSSREITVNLQALDAPGRALARKALDAWESVANIRFQETTGSALIRFDDDEAGANTTVQMRGGTTKSAEVVISADWTAKYGSSVGGYGFQTYVHEIGHALGLGHSGAYNGGASFENATFTNDSWQQTIMSYLDQEENPTVAATKAYVVGPMVADIVAIQTLYGRAQGVTAGNTVFGVGSDLDTYLDAAFAHKAGSLRSNAVALYDAGGIDTLNLSDDSSAQRIDLTAGRFSTAHGRRDGLAIAPGTTIENVQAGSGSDTVIGNGAANRLLGNGGNDALIGAGGHDRLSGGDGSDRLSGGEGNDQLSGGKGNDRLTGGLGADRFDFGHGRDVITDFKNNVDTLRLDDALWGGGPRSMKEVLSLAHRDGADTVFAFGDGSTLRLQGLGGIQSLVDDLLII
jgi:serralysin